MFISLEIEFRFFITINKEIEIVEVLPVSVPEVESGSLGDLGQVELLALSVYAALGFVTGAVVAQDSLLLLEPDEVLQVAVEEADHELGALLLLVELFVGVEVFVFLVPVEQPVEVVCLPLRVGGEDLEEELVAERGQQLVPAECRHFPQQLPLVWAQPCELDLELYQLGEVFLLDGFLLGVEQTDFCPEHLVLLLDLGIDVHAVVQVLLFLQVHHEALLELADGFVGVDLPSVGLNPLDAAVLASHAQVLDLVSDDVHLGPIVFVPPLADVVEDLVVVLDFHHGVVVLVLFLGVVDFLVLVCELLVDCVNLVHVGFLGFLEGLAFRIRAGVEVAALVVVDFERLDAVDFVEDVGLDDSPLGHGTQQVFDVYLVALVPLSFVDVFDDGYVAQLSPTLYFFLILNFDQSVF